MEHVQRPQIALTLRARAILLAFEKIYSCLFIPNCTRNHVITCTKPSFGRHFGFINNSLLKTQDFLFRRRFELLGISDITLAFLKLVKI